MQSHARFARFEGATELSRHFIRAQHKASPTPLSASPRFARRIPNGMRRSLRKLPPASGSRDRQSLRVLRARIRPPESRPSPGGGCGGQSACAGLAI
jgi:hypothetical protein